jgi:hypothetical protein
MCTSCKVQINGKGGQFYIAANMGPDSQPRKQQHDRGEPDGFLAFSHYLRHCSFSLWMRQKPNGMMAGVAEYLNAPIESFSSAEFYLDARIASPQRAAKIEVKYIGFLA